MEYYPSRGMTTLIQSYMPKIKKVPIYKSTITPNGLS